MFLKLTPAASTRRLARCIESVRAQRYKGAIQHLVLVDGESFAPSVRAIVEALQPPATPSPPYASCPEAPHVKNSPCGASQWSAPAVVENGAWVPGAGPRWLDIVYVPFNMHGDGGRIYAAGPNLARGAYVSNLDEDNYYSPDHISSLVDLMVAKDLDWAYTLRTLAMHDEPIAHDRCESLGFLHEVWDWDGVDNFSAAHSQNHVDTNCYMARRPVALALATEWNCLPRHNDRCYLQAGSVSFPSFDTTRSHTVFYDVDPSTEKGIAILGFFSEGLRTMSEKYPGGVMPWEEPEGGGRGPPAAVPMHRLCAGFKPPSVPFFCLPSGSEPQPLAPLEPKSTNADASQQAPTAADDCEEGWTGPDCLQCVTGFSGDFCSKEGSAAAAETKPPPRPPPLPAVKPSRPKGKGKHSTEKLSTAHWRVRAPALSTTFDAQRHL